MVDGRVANEDEENLTDCGKEWTDTEEKGSSHFPRGKLSGKMG